MCPSQFLKSLALEYIQFSFCPFYLKIIEKKKNETIVGRAVQSSTALYLIAPLLGPYLIFPFFETAHLPEENPPYISAFKLVKMAVPTLPTLFQNQHLNRDYDQ